MSAKGFSCRHSFTSTLLELARMEKRIMAVTSDAKGSVTLGDFEKNLPEQFVEVGIAEQNAVGIAAGLARSGKRPFVCGPACFYSARSLEQVKNDVAYAHTDVKIVGVSGGVSYGTLGSTHHSLHDIALFRAIPDIAILLPSDVFMTRKVTQHLASHEGPAYMRIGRSPVPDIYSEDDCPFEFGKATLLASGRDVLLVACGEAVYPTLQASRLLANEGISSTVLDIHAMRPFDDEAILQYASGVKAVVTVEEHSVNGGLGSTVAGILAQHMNRPLKIMGFPDQYPPCGESDELFAWCGLTYAGIAESARELLAKTGKRS
jgi:transketolase